ncbi:MAG: glycosyltransferase family 39 protein [Thermomicrobiales bacterium]
MSVALAQIAFALAHLAAVAPLAPLCYIAGRRLTRGLRFDGAAEAIALATTLGLGALALLTFLLGLVGLLSLPALAALLLPAQLLCAAEWRNTSQRLVTKVRTTKYEVRSKESVPLVSLVRTSSFVLRTSVAIAVVAPVVALTLYPPTQFDATSYHLPAASTFAAQHRIVLLTDLRFPVFPHLNEMLFAVALLAYDDIAAQVVQLLPLALIALLTYAAGRHLFSSRAGAIAAAMLLAQPTLLWVGTAAYVDVCQILFVTALAHAAWRGLAVRDPRWLALAGAFGGFAAATKYQGLVPLGIAVAIVGAAGLRRRSWRGPLAFGLTAALVVAPWYARSWVLAGNPVHPFLPTLFGYGRDLWDAGDVRSQQGRLVSAGAGRSLLDALLLPWNLFANGQRFRALGEPGLIPGYVLACEALILVNLRQPRVRALVLILAPFLVVWFGLFQLQRYLLPALPLAIVAAAGGADRLLPMLPLAQVPRTLRRLALPLACVLLFVPGWLYAARAVAERGAIPVTAAQRDAYLTRQLPIYPAYRYLNETQGNNYSLYALYAENMAYFAHGTVRGDWFGPARYRDARSALPDGRTLYDFLVGQGADHFLVVWGRYPLVLPDDAAFRQHFLPVYGDGQSTVFALVP